MREGYVEKLEILKQEEIFELAHSITYWDTWSNESFGYVILYILLFMVSLCFHQEIVQKAIDSSMKARKQWERTPLEKRAEVFMTAAEMISKQYRMDVMAATMLGQVCNMSFISCFCIPFENFHLLSCICSPAVGKVSQILIYAWHRP